jgi:hypothetical protein
LNCWLITRISTIYWRHLLIATISICRRSCHWSTIVDRGPMLSRYMIRKHPSTTVRGRIVRWVPLGSNLFTSNLSSSLMTIKVKWSEFLWVQTHWKEHVHECWNDVHKPESRLDLVSNARISSNFNLLEEKHAKLISNDLDTMWCEKRLQKTRRL